MTQYPELMELLNDFATSELYNKVSSWISSRDTEDSDLVKDYIDFMEEDLYLLFTKKFPIPDDQGAYDYSALVAFILEFKRILAKNVKKYHGDFTGALSVWKDANGELLVS